MQNNQHLLHFWLKLYSTAQDDETGEVERLMGKVAVPERTCILPSESEDWDLGRSSILFPFRGRN